MNFDILVNESYESLLEYQEFIHSLNMKMIKCEHRCFINEDTNTLLLAEEEYNSRLKDTIKTIYNKIIKKLEEFIILMRKMVNKFRNTFLLSKEFKISMNNVINNQASINSLNNIVFKKNKTGKVYDGVNGDEVQINALNKSKVTARDSYVILGNPKEFDSKLKESFSKILSNNVFNEYTAKEILNNFSRFSENSGNKQTTLTKNEIINAYSVLTKYGVEWIKLFEKIRNEANKQAKIVINANPDRNAALKASIFQRMINKGIMYIQSIMTSCFRVCYAIKNVNTTTNIDFEKEKIKITNDIENFSTTLNKKDGRKILKRIKFLKNIFIRKTLKESTNDNTFITDEKFLDLAEDKVKVMLKLSSLKNNSFKIAKLLFLGKTYEEITRQKEFKDSKNSELCLYSAIKNSKKDFSEGKTHTIVFGNIFPSLPKKHIGYFTHVWIEYDNGEIKETNISSNAINMIENKQLFRVPSIKLHIDGNMTKEEYNQKILKILDKLIKYTS